MSHVSQQDQPPTKPPPPEPDTVPLSQRGLAPDDPVVLALRSVEKRQVERHKSLVDAVSGWREELRAREGVALTPEQVGGEILRLVRTMRVALWILASVVIVAVLAIAVIGGYVLARCP